MNNSYSDITSRIPIYGFSEPTDPRTASNLHADAAIRAGIFGAEVTAILHAELADAYDEIAALRRIDWFGILAELAPSVRFTELDEAARKRGLVIDMRSAAVSLPGDEQP